MFIPHITSHTLLIDTNLRRLFFPYRFILRLELFLLTKEVPCKAFFPLQFSCLSPAHWCQIRAQFEARNRLCLWYNLIGKVKHVSYGCETWSLTLREERRMRVFENRVLRRTFGPKREEIIWNWRKLRNEELNGLYCSPNIFRMIKSGRMR